MLGNLFRFCGLSQRHDRLLLAGLLLLALVVRGGVLGAMRGNLQQDPDAYREIAENLLWNGEFARANPVTVEDSRFPVPTAYRPPLYPLVLSNLPARGGQAVSLAKVAALHLVLGLATVWLTWLTGRRWCGSLPGEGGAESGELATDQHGLHGYEAMNIGSIRENPRSSAAPLLAGLIVACDPILLNQQTLFMTETLAAFLAILSLWTLVRFTTAPSAFNAALAGGSISLAVLCRPTFLPWLGLVGLAMVALRGRNSECRMQNAEWRSWRGLGWRLVNVAGLVVGAAAVLSPWAIRNYRVFGKPIVTTTHGGYTLLLGNNKYFYAWLKDTGAEPVWNPAVFEEQGGAWSGMSLRSEELLIDQFNYSWAHQAIVGHPADFVHACVYRLVQLWSPLPHQLTPDESPARRLLRYATCLWYCGVYLLAALGVRKLRWKLIEPPWLWGVLLCLAFTAVHTFYWTNLRMRAPLMPFVALVAAAAIARPAASCSRPERAL